MNHWRRIHTAVAVSVILAVWTGFALVSSYARMQFVHTIGNTGFYLDRGSVAVRIYDQLPAVLATDGHFIWEFPILGPAALCALAWLIWGMHRIRVWRPYFALAAAASLLGGFGTIYNWATDNETYLPNTYRLWLAASPTAKPMSLNLGFASYSMWRISKGPMFVHEIVIPYGTAVLVSSILPWLWFRSFCRHRKRSWAACRVCHYDLTANASGVCPECGSSTGIVSNA